MRRCLTINILTVLLLNLFSFDLSAATYILKVRELDFTQEKVNLPKLLDRDFYSYNWREEITWSPTLRVPSTVEAYVARDTPPSKSVDSIKQGDLLVAIKVEGDQPISGFLDLQNHSANGLSAFPFRFDPSSSKKCSLRQFEIIKTNHFTYRASASILGKPWFKQFSHQDEKQFFSGQRIDQNQLFSFFSGGQAIADNLALTRNLVVSDSAAESKKNVQLSTIQGVKTKAIQWQPQPDVTIDPLSLSVPYDQHILISPSLAHLDRLITLLESDGSPLAQSFTVRNPFRQLPTRYKKQMGLDFSLAKAAILPVKSVALTGSDPFFPTGTDLAVILESDKPQILYQLLHAALTTKAKSHSAKYSNTLHSNNCKHAGYSTPDRAFSSHILCFGNTVVITNSLNQARRLLQVHSSKIPSLGDSDEYRFFRHRYPLTDKKAGYIFLSDACIRRWCGPRLRIAASRRNRAIAALQHLTSKQLNAEELGEDYRSLLGTVVSADDVVHSTELGSLPFMLPIAELDISHVTQAEKDAYEQWREGYESGWQNVFDPIAVSFDLTDDACQLDLSVLPLSINSEYREFIEIVGQGRLSLPSQLSHPESVMMFSCVLDKETDVFRKFAQQMTSMMPNLKVNPLAWMAGSVSIYADQSSFWKLLPHASNLSSIDTSFLRDLHCAIRLESESSIKLALFLTALKGLSNSAAPDSFLWQTKKHGKRSYVAVSSDDNDLDFTIYYATTPTALLISLNENMLKRAIDREISLSKKDIAKTSNTHLFLEGFASRFLAVSALDGLSLEASRKQQSWRAIPILNQWKRNFPDADPLDFHRQHFGEDIFCPGGQGYRWNTAEMTMESVVYGHPASLDSLPPKSKHLLTRLNYMTSSLVFEDGGLRLKLKLQKKPEPQFSKFPILDTPVIAATKDFIIAQPNTSWEYNYSRTFNGDEKIGTQTIKNLSFSDDNILKQEVNENIDEPRTSVRSFDLTNGLDLLAVDMTTQKAQLTYSVPNKMLPLQLRLGQRSLTPYSFVITSEEGQRQGTGFCLSAVKSVENLTVPAGAFEGCIRVDYTYTSVVHARISTHSFSYWFHPQVGLVKSTGSATHFATSIELTKFTPQS